MYPTGYISLDILSPTGYNKTMKTISKTTEFVKWLEKLDIATAARVLVRIDRMEDGHYGDHKRFDGLIEVRLHFGAGYRLYCVERSGELIVLLAGGDKSTQKKDIKLAKDLADNL